MRLARTAGPMRTAIPRTGRTGTPSGFGVTMPLLKMNASAASETINNPTTTIPRR